ncbi:MAG: carbon storage regulator CsrA [Oscillospiraceae bacterium]
MLVLTRKENEGIVIGDNIKVTVLAIDGEKIKLGVDAPMSMRIFREELIRETGEENRNALNSPLVTFDMQ